MVPVSAAGWADGVEQPASKKIEQAAVVEAASPIRRVRDRCEVQNMILQFVASEVFPDAGAFRPVDRWPGGPTTSNLSDH
ncbi:hypothetical protein GCM10027056_09770 [Glaciibacter psychrotolerans]